MSCHACPTTVNNLNSCSPCCETPQNPLWFSLVEQVTAVALAVFAFQVSADLFVPFFLVGIVIGGYQALTSDPAERDNGAAMGCSRGLMEQLTRVKLPRLVSLAADVAVMWCHIDHHSTVFVPMIGLYAGAKLTVTGADLARRCVSAYQNQAVAS